MLSLVSQRVRRRPGIGAAVALLTATYGGSTSADARPDVTRSASQEGAVPSAVTDGHAVANSGAIAAIDLSGRWTFTQIQPSARATTIQVPGGGWIKQGFTTTREAEYARTITVPVISAAQTVMLEFGAVNHEATLMVDGRIVGTQTTSYTPQRFDITPFVKPGGTHKIALRVKGREALTKDGKYLVAEGAEWSTTVPQGIYRSAFLRVYPPAYVASTFVKTSVRNKTVSYDVELRNTSNVARTVQLSGSIASATGDDFRYPTIPAVTVMVPANTVVKKSMGPFVWAAGSVSYWWPNLPYKSGYRARLHVLTVEMKGEGGTRQTTRTRFGFREFSQPTGQTKYYLNGVAINLRGDNLQVADYDRIDRNGQSDAVDLLPGFLPPSPGNPGWPRAVDNYQRLNFNIVRLHQSPVSPYMIDVLDEMGIMAIGESAIRGSAGREHFIAGHDNMVAHVRDLVLQHRNHPSIIEWSQSNETDQADTDSEQFEKDLFHAIRAVDPTRPIITDGPPPGHYPTMTPRNGFTQYNTFEHYMDGFANYGTAMTSRTDVPNGETEYLWPATSTPAGFTWFATATVGKRGRGAADLRPYTLLSGWAGFVPGTRTTDFVTEEKRPPLYGDDNLPDPWDHPQIQLIQRGFSPYLVADLAYWDQSGRSDDTGTFPVKTSVQPIGFGQRVTRDVAVFNDGLQGTAIDFAWAIRAESPTGEVLASGKRRLSVPLADKVTVPVIFTSPKTGKGVYLTLSSSVDGVVRFTDSSQYLPLGSASSIDDAEVASGDRQIAYSGAWDHVAGQPGSYATTLSSSSTTGASAIVRFTGNVASIHAATGPNRGIVGISVDRGPEVLVDLYAATPASDQTIWSSPILTSGPHTLSMRLTGEKNPAAKGVTASLDRIEAPTSSMMTVMHAGSRRCLNLRGRNVADGAPVDLAACDGGTPQSWTLDSDGQLVNRESGKCLDIANASTQVGALVQQWACNRGGNQKWAYDIRQRLTNPASGLCLHADNHAGATADRMAIRKCDDSPANRWALRLSAKATIATAPRDVTTVAGDGAIAVSWKAPLSDGGAEITKYTVSSTPKSKGCVTSTGWSTYTCTVPGLTNGKTYTFTVTAQNWVGIGPAAIASAPVAPRE